MKMVKSLILGSATALVAMSGAQAADLPVKAKAVEYVKVCSLYGAGFWYIPGTDTCIKLGGYLRYDVTGNGNIYDGPFWNGDTGAKDRYANYLNQRSRFALTVDTRTATEYGVVRTFAQSDWQFSTYGASGSLGTQASLNNGALVGQVNNDTAGNGYVGVEFVFVQFAGFTFGKSASAYATPWHGYPGNNSSFLIGGYDSVTGVNNIQYTAQFGNGVSATIGADDNSASNFNRTQIYNLIPGAAGGSISFLGSPSSSNTTVGSDYAGTLIPDIVGNVRVDQAWGLFQVSGALHSLRAAYNGTANVISSAQFATGATQVGNETTGHPADRFGGAVMAALQIKNLPTGPGDDIKIDATYSSGASKYVLATSSATPSSFDIFENSNTPGVTKKFAMGVVSDAVFAGTGTSLQRTEGWGIRGAFNHNWDPYWSTSLFGGSATLRYNATAITQYCAIYNSAAVTGAKGAGYSCNPGFTLSEVGIVTRWTPVKNLTFSGEVLYAYLDTKMTGSSATTAAGANSALPLAAGVYQYRDLGTLSVNFRVQRNF